MSMAIKFQHLRKVIRLSHTQWRLLPRYALIAAILGGVSYLFAFTGGWVTWPAHASRLSPKQIINAFEANTGAHPGFRRNHAKGICVTGRFESNGNATALSRASV